MPITPLDFEADPCQKHPIDLLEPLEDADERDLQGVTAEAVRAVIDFLVPQEPLRRGAWETAKWRLLALAHLMIHRVQERSLTELATAAETSRAVLSYHSIQLVNRVGLPNPGGKTRSGRERYALAQKAAWKRRQASTAPGGEPHPENDRTPLEKPNAAQQWARHGSTTPDLTDS
jgi:hypothetical protein